MVESHHQELRVDRKGTNLFQLSEELSINEPLAPQDEFLDVIYWSKQVLGIFMGVIWGIFPLKGLIGLVL